ncbi:MAG: multidrug efflux SMR transporter [Saprospiraceae bacterium]|mgnify:FL=1|nr:multidrug efflux SMR transporter [Saprospiraceae bacterium]
MGYLYLLLTIIFETAAILFMKMSEGASHRTYLVLGGLSYAATFFLLTMALKYLPMGSTNAIWAGTSTILVYAFGVYYFKEKTNFWEFFFLACIVVGLVGLNFMNKGK